MLSFFNKSLSPFFREGLCEPFTLPRTNVPFDPLSRRTQGRSLLGSSLSPCRTPAKVPTFNAHVMSVF